MSQVPEDAFEATEMMTQAPELAPEAQITFRGKSMSLTQARESVRTTGKWFWWTAALMLALAGCHTASDADDDPQRWELKVSLPGSEPVTATEKLPGIYPAGSRIKDREALGGFGLCSNYPKDLVGKEWGTNGAVSVIAVPDYPAAYFKHCGFPLRVVNRTGQAIPFAACDSVLYLVREAQDSSGTWREIESLPQPICGNSFHRVFLGPGQYWEFPAREYSGTLLTKVRFRLDPGSDRPPIYSNEFEGLATEAQFGEGP